MAAKKALTAMLCRMEAEKCRRLAIEAKQQDHGVMLEQMAQTWERIAADIERQRR